MFVTNVCATVYSICLHTASCRSEAPGPKNLDGPARLSIQICSDRELKRHAATHLATSARVSTMAIGPRFFCQHEVNLVDNENHS